MKCVLPSLLDQFDMNLYMNVVLTVKIFNSCALYMKDHGLFEAATFLGIIALQLMEPAKSLHQDIIIESIQNGASYRSDADILTNPQLYTAHISICIKWIFTPFYIPLYFSILIEWTITINYSQINMQLFALVFPTLLVLFLFARCEWLATSDYNGLLWIMAFINVEIMSSPKV